MGLVLMNWFCGSSLIVGSAGKDFEVGLVLHPFWMWRNWRVALVQ